MEGARIEATRLLFFCGIMGLLCSPLPAAHLWPPGLGFEASIQGLGAQGFRVSGADLQGLLLPLAVAGFRLEDS